MSIAPNVRSKAPHWVRIALFASIVFAASIPAESLAQVVPSNDNFASATVLPATVQTLAGQSNRSASLEKGEAGLGLGSIWYAWTSPLSADVQLNTCGTRDFDTTLGVYQGADVTTLTILAENDDFCGVGSQVTFSATAGQTYHFRLGGAGRSSGTTDIDWGYVNTVVSTLSANSGPLGGGTAVTISGFGFSDTTNVTFGGIDGTGLVVIDDNTIAVTTPAATVPGAVDVVVTGPTRSGTLIGGFTYQQDATTATEFAAKEDAIRDVIVDAAQRSLSATLAGNRRLVGDARTRFINSRRDSGDEGSLLVTRNDVAFDVDGTAEAADGVFGTSGSFFGQRGDFDGTYRRVFFGDFNVQHDSDTGSTTGTISGKLAWERAVSDRTMLGFYIGAEIGQSAIAGSFAAKQATHGASIGGYFVSALQENLFLDGFVSIGASRNLLRMSDGTLDLATDYLTRTGTVGASLTGVVERPGYEIWPELAFTYGKTLVGTTNFIGRAYGLIDNDLSLDAGNVSVANLTLKTEFRVPMDGRTGGDSNLLFTFAPRVICEQVATASTVNSCGGGAEFGIVSATKDGLGQLNAKIMLDQVGDSTRTGLEINLEHRF